MSYVMASPRLQQQIVSASLFRPLILGILVIIPQLAVAIGFRLMGDIQKWNPYGSPALLE